MNSKNRFDGPPEDQKIFKWTQFYQEFADKLLKFKSKQEDLIKGIHQIASKPNPLTLVPDKYSDGSSAPLEEICPFTIIGTFNKGLTIANRQSVAKELADFLGVLEDIPNEFNGIPLLNNQASWFFGYHEKRKPDDIQTLWECFEQAIILSESDTPESRSDFIRAFDEAMSRHQVGWTLTMGLYWIRPWRFATLETKSRKFINGQLDIEIKKSGHKDRCSGADYLSLLDDINTKFKDDLSGIRSFPALSLAAWQVNSSDSGKSSPEEAVGSGSEITENQINLPASYSAEDIIEEGCFVRLEELKKMIGRLSSKKNLILQGPPGTGKTWLARRLAFAMIGQKNKDRVRAVQFHPNLSYEDFIRGWRPSGDGKLTLVDGPFVEMIKLASKQPDSRYVMLIEEINRGNPAQIFGEMLTLLETDKRTQEDALELTYSHNEGESIFIPDNLYVIGTMNIADRSIALVDLALRRRFAFIELEPALGDTWSKWVKSNFNLDMQLLKKIEDRINSLNQKISDDINLGPQFCIGHSYVTPSLGDQIDDVRIWFQEIVDTEIGPILDEYWFDNPEKAKKERVNLVENF